MVKTRLVDVGQNQFDGGVGKFLVSSGREGKEWERIEGELIREAGNFFYFFLLSWSNTPYSVTR